MSENLYRPYHCVNHHPKSSTRLDTVGSVLHSVCATKGCTWVNAYEKLIDASGELGLMPQDRKTIQKMLGDHGFFLQSSSFAKRTVRELIEECDQIFHDGEVLILKLAGSVKYGCYVPLVPFGRGAHASYRLHFPSNQLGSMVTEVWIAWGDGQDHSIKPRRKRRTTAKTAAKENKTVDNEALVVFNENPNDNLIGDCAVRAVAGVFEISWKEAVRKLAAAQDYTATVINQTNNIAALLRKEGFQEFDAIRRNGRILTGKQFCDIIHDMFQAGTRIYAYVDHNHAVAILVFDEDYKIVDTWDSTNHLITKYWAKYPDKPQRSARPPKPAEKPEKLTELSVGMKIRHSAYGIGEITGITDAIAVVQFDGAEKKLASAWILANCKPV